ncbi:MAG: hypothetical protein C0485_14440 [Pirellula sp.]|nr:hypothetical protein [Pirellula sp.]
MHKNADSPDFDSLDDEPAPAVAAAAAKPGDFWRLGHKRPWWQWNVITLFVSLFALTWVRELAGVSQTATWMICVAVFCVWMLAPAIVETITAVDDAAGERTDARASVAGRAVAYLGSLAILVGIMAYAGIHIGIFSVLAVILMAVAVRARHD